MIPALLIGAFVVIVGAILYIFELRWRRSHKDVSLGDKEKSAGSSEAGDLATVSEESGVQKERGEECCGLHLVCEKDSLSPMSAEIIYYDDEELDRFLGRDPYTYTPDEVEEFRDVLMTLRPEDVNGWARSITQRRLELPSDVRDELLMLVNEQRQMKNS